MLVISITALIAIYGLAYVAGSSRYSYEKLYWIFEAAHFSAGFFLGMFFSNFVTDKWQVVGLVFAVGLLWEIWEFTCWNIPSLRRKIIKKGSITLPDTLLDLFLDTLGGVVFVLILL